MSVFRADGDDLLLACYLQPRASKTEVIGEHNGAVKIRISAPPVDGAANTELVAFLAKQFGVSKSPVRIESGSNNRHKCVRIKTANKHPGWLNQ
jgi:uncharacterized protein